MVIIIGGLSRLGVITYSKVVFVYHTDRKVGTIAAGVKKTRNVMDVILAILVEIGTLDGDRIAYVTV